MADKYADLPGSERIDKAVELLREHPSLSLRKVSAICDVHVSSVSRRVRGVTKPQKKVCQERQLLTPAEETRLIRYALLYFNRGFPLQIKSLRQFALDI